MLKNWSIERRRPSEVVWELGHRWMVKYVGKHCLEKEGKGNFSNTQIRKIWAGTKEWSRALKEKVEGTASHCHREEPPVCHEMGSLVRTGAPTTAVHTQRGLPHQRWAAVGSSEVWGILGQMNPQDSPQLWDAMILGVLLGLFRTSQIDN